MVGRDMTHRFPERTQKPSDEVVMSVRDVCSPLAHSFQHISFDLRRGEILGIGGLVGAQRTEFVETLFGLREIASDSVTKDGQAFCLRSAQDAKAHGLALLTEERRATDIFGILPILENTVVANQRE